MRKSVLIFVLGLTCCLILIGCDSKEAVDDGVISYHVPRSDFMINLPDTWVVEENTNEGTGEPFALHLRPSEEEDLHFVSVYGYQLHENQRKQQYIDDLFEFNGIEATESIESDDLSGSIGRSRTNEQTMDFAGILGTERQIVVVFVGSNSVQSDLSNDGMRILIEVMNAISMEEENPRKAEIVEQKRINGTNFKIGRLKNYTLQPFLEYSMKMETLDSSAPRLYIWGHPFERENVPGGWDIPYGERAAEEWLAETRSPDAILVEDIETENGLLGIVETFDEPESFGLIKRVTLIYKDQGIAVDLFGLSFLEEENDDILFTAIESIEWDENIEE